MEFRLVPSFLRCQYHLEKWPQVCLLAFLCILSVITCHLKRKSQAVNYWPFLGTLPSLLCNSKRLPEWLTEIFTKLGRGSFFVEGPIFMNLKYLVTCHPQNIEYILKTNFTNFPKGPDFKEVFEILGNGIFNADYESWLSQRKMAHACFSSAEFRSLVANVSLKLVEDALIPFLAHVAREGTTIDLEDVCRRYAFESNMRIIFGRDEGSLSIDLPTNRFAEAFDDAQEAILQRHAMPTFVWKLLRWLRLGKETRLSKAWRTVDLILKDYISLERENLHKGVERSNLLYTYVKSPNDSSKNDTFLRDAILSLFTAGRDTIASGLVWFLWLVATTPHVEGKILEELLRLVVWNKKRETTTDETKKRSWVLFDSDDLKGLVYLHAALCESMRLYPPLPLNSKAVIKEDVLPDGTKVKPGMQIILSFYSEGKMPWVWGEDCLEFKPERWIDDEGKLSYAPMSKFFAFNAGPRSCLGKSMSFTLMKSVVAATLFNFRIQVLEGQRITSKPYISLHMNEGLMVKITERIT